MADNHSFNVNFAKKFGVEESLIFDFIYHWCVYNKNNNQNFYEDKYWTYNTLKAFEEEFLYLNLSKIRRVIKNLLDLGFIIIGNFNKLKYDHTNWYSITEKGETEYLSCCNNHEVTLYSNFKMTNRCAQNEQIEDDKMTNLSAQNDTTIPTSNTTSIPTSNTTPFPEPPLSNEDGSNLTSPNEISQPSSSAKASKRKATKKADVSETEKLKEYSTEEVNKSRYVVSLIYNSYRQLDDRFIRNGTYFDKQTLTLLKFKTKDNIPWEEINNIVSFAISDNFWKDKIKGVEQLVRCYSTLRARLNSKSFCARKSAVDNVQKMDADYYQNNTW